MRGSNWWFVARALLGAVWFDLRALTTPAQPPVRYRGGVARSRAGSDVNPSEILRAARRARRARAWPVGIDCAHVLAAQMSKDQLRPRARRTC